MKNFKIICVLFGLILLSLVLSTSKSNAQPVSQWLIPGQPNIQGLDALYPEDPYNFVYFTEFDQMKIGRLTSISPPWAMLSEWSPSGTEMFHPFKIVAGKWNFATKIADPTYLTTEPFLNSPVDVKTKDMLKYITIGFNMWAMSTFTLPNESSVGMLVHSPWAGVDAFWVWPTMHTGLDKPWDIQRRAISADETSCWISNNGSDMNALWQFFPATNTIQKWDLTQCGIKVNVFYVVPAPRAKGKTEIWIGGNHITNAGMIADCIVYMVVDGKNSAALLRIWDLPMYGQSRNMNAIMFTQKPTKDGFRKMQVWLSSSTIPEMTILEPYSLLDSKLVDRVCVLREPLYRSPNGLFWNDPVYTTLTSADNDRRIWITSGADSNMVDMLTANKSTVPDTIRYIICQTTPTPIQLERIVYKAKRMDRELTSEAFTEHIQDSIPCNIDRYIWDPSTGLNVDFTGAMLDIDMQGKAASIAGSSGFDYTILWHEPMKGVIGMLWSTTPPIPRTIFDNPYELQQPEEFSLHQNYPNPFNPTTTINYTVPEAARVSLKVYNSLGQEVAVLLDNELVEAGEHSVDFNSSNLPSGVYFYRINAVGISEVEGDNGEVTQQTSGKTLVNVKKMLLLK